MSADECCDGVEHKLDHLTSLVEDLAKVVRKLDEVVRTGNGKASLMTQVEVLKIRQDNDEVNRKQDMKVFGGVVTTLAGVVSAAVAALSQALATSGVQ